MAALNLGHLEAFMGLNTIGLTKGLAGAQAALNRSAVSMQKIGRTMTMSLSVPLGIIGGLAVNTFAKFEKSMNQVASVTLGTADEMQSLSEVARHLGETTKFSAVEAAEGMNFLAMTGFEVQEIMDSLPAALNLAAAGNMDLGRSADIVTNIMRGFGIEAARTTEVTDILTATFTNANANLEQIGESMAFAAPVAAAYGQSIATTAAVVGMLGDAGIQASRAGTGVRQMLLQLDKKSQDLGISMRDAEGNVRDMADILLQLEQSGIKADQAIKVVGPRAGVALAALMARGSKELREFTEQVENMGGITARIAETQLKGLSGAWIEMKSASAELGIAFGSVLAPAIENLVDNVKMLIKRWASLDTGTKKLVLTIAGLVAGIGPAIFIIGKLAAAIALLWGPIGIVIAAIAALGAAIIYIWDNWEAIIERISDWSWWKNVLVDMAQFLIRYNVASLMLKSWNAAVNWIKGRWDDLVVYVSSIDWWEKMLILMGNALEKYGPIAKFKELWKILTGETDLWAELFGGAKDELKKIESNILFNSDKWNVGSIPDVFEGMALGLEGLRDDTKEYEHEFGSFGDAMANAVDKGKKALIGLFDTITGGKEGVVNVSDYIEVPKALEKKDLFAGFGEDITPRMLALEELLSGNANSARMLTGSFVELGDGTEGFAMSLDGVNRRLMLQQEIMRRHAEYIDIQEEKMYNLAKIITNLVTNAFDGLGNAIISGMEQGQSALESFGQFFVKFAKSLIAKMITMIVTALVLAAALSFIPGVGVASSGKIIKGMKEAQSFGTAFKNILSGGLGVAQAGTALTSMDVGGMTTSGGLFQLHKDEVVALPSGTAVTPANVSGGQMVYVKGRLETSGTQLYYVIEEENRKRGNTFGA